MKTSFAGILRGTTSCVDWNRCKTSKRSFAGINPERGIADAAAVVYIALLTLAVAANIGVVAVVLWALAASWLTYRKAAST